MFKSWRVPACHTSPVTQYVQLHQPTPPTTAVQVPGSNSNPASSCLHFAVKTRLQRRYLHPDASSIRSRAYHTKKREHAERSASSVNETHSNHTFRVRWSTPEDRMCQFLWNFLSDHFYSGVECSWRFCCCDAHHTFLQELGGGTNLW